LADARQRVGDALAKVSGQRNALKALDVGASLAEDVARNVTLWDNPTDVAARVYTGVLYEAAGAASWDGVTLARAAERIRIVSALWGAVSPADAIPAYRLSMGTSLGRIGPLAAFWRKHLPPQLGALADGGLVVDCRSSDYMAAWKPVGTPWVAVRVERELHSRRTVVSHMAKHTRGLLAAHLITLDTAPETPGELADAARTLVGTDLRDVSLSASANGPDTLTLVVAG
jgi:cytoplasmic iron level regulating protein YaaA (DUF328/UPF0246 family)